MPQAQFEGEKDRILVVDDEPSMRKTVAAILRAEGYSVDVAASGEEAVELCSRSGYAVVLMDVRMPGIDGVEAFRGFDATRKACESS